MQMVNSFVTAKLILNGVADVVFLEGRAGYAIEFADFTIKHQLGRGVTFGGEGRRNGQDAFKEAELFLRKKGHENAFYLPEVLQFIKNRKSEMLTEIKFV